MRRTFSFAVVLALLAAAFGTMIPAQVSAATLLSLTSTTTTVNGGKSVAATVKLDVAASTGGQIVTLTSSDTSLATVPASVTVAAGRISASVSIKTLAVSSNRTVTVTAGSAGVTRSLTLTLTPAVLYSMSVPKSLAGGATGSGTVTLAGTAPSSGLVVALDAGGGVATVPASVTVPAGKTSATFAISTSPVSTASSTTISATYKGVTKTGIVSVVLPTVLSVSVSPSSVGPGVTATATVKLTGPALSGGSRVTISLDAPGPLTIPSSVTVPQGQTSATFSVTGQTASAVTKVTLRAAMSSSRTTVVTVSPATIYSVKFNASSIVYNGTATGTLTMTADAPDGGATIALSASSTALTVPASVTVPAGSRTATFTVTGNSPVTQTSVRVTGTYGSASKYGLLTVKASPPPPLGLAEIAVLPNPVGGESSVGIGIALTGTAPVAGFPVTLTSSNQSLLPLSGTYTITSGNDLLMVFPTTAAVSSQQQVTVSVSGGGKALSAVITIKPYVLYSVNLPTSSTVGGNQATGRVYLTGKAPAGGVIVELASGNTSLATVPATVTIPAGQTNASFAITTSAVTSTRGVTITATAGGSSVSGSMNVDPLKVTGFGTFPSTLASGNSGTAVISINGVPGSGGATVALKSSNPAVASVPPSVTITSGTSKTFTITAGTVTTPTAVTISATLGGATVSKTVTVSPPALSGVSAPNPILLETTVSGQVTLTGPAPAGGLTVSLTSSSPSAASVPNSVTVPAGSTTAAFAIVGGSVAGPVNVTIAATAGGVTKTGTTQVIPIGPWQGQLSTAARTCASGGRSYSFALSGPAPGGGLTVSITTSNGLIAPATVSVPAGATSFSVTACAYPILNYLSGGLTATANGLSANYVLGIPNVSQSIVVDQPTVTGGTPLVVTWNISDPAGPGGLTTTVSSSNAAVVPGFSLTIPEGEKTVSTTLIMPVVSAQAVVVLRTTGYRSDDVSFTIVLPKVRDMTVAPDILTGGESATGSVMIDGPAPVGGTTVSLTSNSGHVLVPATVVVPAGATSTTFVVSTTAPTASVSAVITASGGSGSASAGVTVNPPVVVAEVDAEATTEEVATPEATAEPTEEPAPEVAPEATPAA